MTHPSDWPTLGAIPSTTATISFLSPLHTQRLLFVVEAITCKSRAATDGVGVIAPSSHWSWSDRQLRNQPHFVISVWHSKCCTQGYTAVHTTWLASWAGCSKWKAAKKSRSALGRSLSAIWPWSPRSLELRRLRLRWSNNNSYLLNESLASQTGTGIESDRCRGHTQPTADADGEARGTPS